MHSWAQRRGSRRCRAPSVSAGASQSPQLSAASARTLLLCRNGPESSPKGTFLGPAESKERLVTSGFRNLMMSYEGVDVAHHLNELGIDAFILKYRLTYTDPNAQPAAARPTAARSGGPQAGQNVGKLRAPTASRRCV